MAYAESSSIPFETSTAQIVAFLRKHGADQIGQFEGDGIFAIQFTLADRRIRFRVGLADKRIKRRPDQVRRQRGRALLLVIKAKVESVEAGIESIEQAFLAHIVTSTGETVHERIAEPLAIEYQTGQPGPVAGLLGGPSDG